VGGIGLPQAAASTVDERPAKAVMPHHGGDPVQANDHGGVGQA